MPGPQLCAVWLILVPQLFVAVATVAGMAGAAANALSVLVGGYSVIEKLAAALGAALTAAVLTAAATAAPEPAELSSGLVPRLPAELDVGEVLPWLGFMLARAAGLMFFSYWTDARGYGGSGVWPGGSVDRRQLGAEDREALRGWTAFMPTPITFQPHRTSRKSWAGSWSSEPRSSSCRMSSAKIFNEGTEFTRDGSQFDRLLVDGDTLVIGEIPLIALHVPAPPRL